jgi:hypothetical protein
LAGKPWETHNFYFKRDCCAPDQKGKVSYLLLPEFFTYENKIDRRAFGAKTSMPAENQTNQAHNQHSVEQ